MCEGVPAPAKKKVGNPRLICIFSRSTPRGDNPVGKLIQEVASATSTWTRNPTVVESAYLCLLGHRNHIQGHCPLHSIYKFRVLSKDIQILNISRLLADNHEVSIMTALSSILVWDLAR